MPICSYIAYPVTGKKWQVVEELQSFQNCDVFPAENEEMIIIVTETPDRKTEDDLRNRLEGISDLQYLSMAFGHV